MPKIKTIIADDESIARDVLKELVQNHQEIEVVAETNTLADTFHKAATLQPDILFLDIQFKEGNSFSIIKDFNQLPKSPDIIFTTAYDQFAIDAFRIKAIDYLLKPVTQEDFDKAICHYKDRREQKRTPGFIPETRRFLETISDKRISINTRTSEHLLRPNEIIYITADGPYSDFHLLSGKTICASLSLKSLLDILPDYMFFRISRSTIINTNYLNEINHKERTCHLMPKEKEVVLDISKNRLQNLKSFMNQFI